MRCGFLRNAVFLLHAPAPAPTPYSMVFLLHAPASAPIKIGCGLVWCGLVGCVGEAYTPTLRDLETTRQRENETFPEFLVRWRAKALKMMNRPNEKDQVNMVMKGLLLVYYN